MTINRLFSIGHFIFSGLKAKENISCLMRPVSDEPQDWGNVCSQNSPSSSNPLGGCGEDKIFLTGLTNFCVLPSVPRAARAEITARQPRRRDRLQTAENSNEFLQWMCKTKKISSSVCEWGWLGDPSSLTQSLKQQMKSFCDWLGCVFEKSDEKCMVEGREE